MTQNGAQRVTFEWKHDKEWAMCYECQEELLKVVGRFFGIPQRAEELKKPREVKSVLETEKPKPTIHRLGGQTVAVLPLGMDEATVKSNLAALEKMLGGQL